MSGSTYQSSGTTLPGETFTPSRAQDIRAIEQRLGDFVAAWNRHDSVQMAAQWFEDGDLINTFGRIAKGRDQVQELFRDEHSGPMKTCTHKMAIQAIRMASDDVAIVDAECTLIGLRGPDGKELPTLKPHVVLVLGKKESDWKVFSARPYVFSTGLGAAS